MVIWGCFWGSLCAWLAGQKGRSGTSWFILGFFFAGIALIVLGFSPSVEEQSAGYVSMRVAEPAPLPSPSARDYRSTPGRAAPNKKCPDCAEQVLADARICRFCRHEFADLPMPSKAAPVVVAVPRSDKLPISYGSWRVTAKGAGMPLGAAIQLRLEMKKVLYLVILASSWSFGFEADSLVAESSQGLLTLTSDRGSVSLQPLDGQDLADVARELNRGG